MKIDNFQEMGKLLASPYENVCVYVTFDRHNRLKRGWQQSKEFLCH